MGKRIHVHVPCMGVAMVRLVGLWGQVLRNLYEPLPNGQCTPLGLTKDFLHLVSCAQDFKKPIQIYVTILNDRVSSYFDKHKLFHLFNVRFSIYPLEFRLDTCLNFMCFDTILDEHVILLVMRKIIHASLKTVKSVYSYFTCKI